jgi:hypothetical protein
MLLALASCQTISGLDEIEIVGEQGGSGGGPPCDPGLLDRNRDPNDGCEYAAPISTDALVLWLSGDFGVVLDAGGVDGWLDQSNRRNDFSADLPSNQPALMPAAVNGLDAVTFYDDKLQNQAVRSDFSRGITFAAVVRRDVQGFQDTLFDMVVEGGPSDNKNIYLSQENERDNLWFGSTIEEANVTISSAGLYTPNTLHLVTIASAPSTLRFRFDGTDGLPQPPMPPDLPATEMLHVVLGANIATQNTRFHRGIIAEVILYERALDDGELSAVEQYLRAKWGCCD